VLRRTALALAVTSAAACAMSPTPTTSEAAPAPLTGVDGSTDSADRSCNVIMREGLPIEANGWQATIEVSAAAAAANPAAPALLWQAPGSSTWQTTAGVAVTDNSATPGYVRYAVTVPVLDQAFAAIPYLPLAAGGRLFDHNRNAGDGDNYQITSPDYSIWQAPAVCAAPSSPTVARLTFNADFTQTQTNQIVAGGQLEVDYDPTRLAGCSETQGGRPQWSITAHIKFDPDGEEETGEILDGPVTVTVPTDGAKQVEIWFESVNVDGCHQFDSNYGSNFVFALALPPQWLGLAQNLLSRDESSPCAGGTDAAMGFDFDTWARERAYETNLCFQAYQPGETDVPDPDLWKQLNAKLSYRYTAGTQASPWIDAPVNLDGSSGNNAQYAFSWRDVDPFRDFHCPEVAPVPTSDNMYVEIQVEYVVSVNGAEIHPQAGADFVGNFIDYPSNPWRTANCPAP
jgi:hypothetical protein